MAVKRWVSGAHYAVLATFLASAAPTLAAGALWTSAWALETFIDVTESDGRVVAVELRRPCGISVHATALAFWYKVVCRRPRCMSASLISVLSSLVTSSRSCRPSARGSPPSSAMRRVSGHLLCLLATPSRTDRLMNCM